MQPEKLPDNQGSGASFHEDRLIAKLGLTDPSAALKEILKIYSESLQLFAERCVRCWSVLRQGDKIENSARELLHEFYLKKLLDPASARKMYTPVMESGVPLEGRLLVAFKNFIADVKRVRIRQKAHQVSSDPAMIDGQPQSNGQIGEPWQTYFDRQLELCKKYNNTIRAVFKGDRRSVWYEGVALFRVRQKLFLGCIRRYQNQAEESVGVTKAVRSMVDEFVEKAPWYDQEKKRSLGTDGYPALEEVWRRVVHLITQPPHRVEDQTVAAIVGINRNTWSQWWLRALKTLNPSKNNS